VGKESLSATMVLNLGSKPASHPLSLGIEFIIKPMINEVHTIKVDEGKNRDDVRLVKRGASKSADLPRRDTSVVQANGRHPVFLPLPGHKVPNGQFLGGSFANYNDPAHI
jgi:hypothetical protein